MKPDAAAFPAGTQALVRNATALFGSQAVGLLVPLVTVPYLARVLRPEGWAPVLAAQALGNWLILMLEYGFDLSGTRAVARVRHEPGALPGVVRGVQSAKLLLIPLATVVLIIAFVTVPALRAHRAFLPWTLAFAILRGLNPFWYFQGIERVHGAAVVEAVSRALAAAGVFVVVRSAADGWRVLALQAVFAAVSLTVLTTWMARDTALLRPAIKDAVTALRESWTIFAYRAAGGLYNQASALILGLIGSLLAVATFGGAERIVRAAISLLQPLTQAFLPRVSSLRATNPAMALQLIDRCLIGVGLFGAAMGVAALAGAPILVRALLGPGYEAAVPLMRVLAVLPPVVAVNTVLGLYWAVPFGHERAVLNAVIAAALANIVLVWLLVPRWGALGMCAAVVASEVLVTIVLGSLFLQRRRST
jgi:PST family polysaccharide transporter